MPQKNIDQFVVIRVNYDPDPYTLKSSTILALHRRYAVDGSGDNR